jgi:hypothetical protein
MLHSAHLVMPSLEEHVSNVASLMYPRDGQEMQAHEFASQFTKEHFNGNLNDEL